MCIVGLLFLMLSSVLSLLPALQTEIFLDEGGVWRGLWLVTKQRHLLFFQDPLYPSNRSTQLPLSPSLTDTVDNKIFLMNCSFGKAWFWDEAQSSKPLVTGISGIWWFAKKKITAFFSVYHFSECSSLLFFFPRKLKLQCVQCCIRGYSVRECSQGWAYRVMTSPPPQVFAFSSRAEKVHVLYGSAGWLQLAASPPMRFREPEITLCRGLRSPCLQTAWSLLLSCLCVLHRKVLGSAPFHTEAALCSCLHISKRYSCYLFILTHIQSAFPNNGDL